MIIRKSKMKMCVLCLIILSTVMATVPGPIKNIFLLMGIVCVLIGGVKKKGYPSIILGWLLWLAIFPVIYFFISGYRYGNKITEILPYITVIAAMCMKTTDGTSRFHFPLNMLKGITIFECVGIIYEKLATDSYFNFVRSQFPLMYDTLFFRYNKYGYMSGFTTEVSFAAGLLVLGMHVFLFSYLYFDKKQKKINAILLFLTFIALALTMKRSHLIFGIVGCFFTLYFVDNSRHKSKWVWNVFKFMFVCIIAIIVIYQFYGGSESIVGRLVTTVFNLVNGVDIDTARSDFNAQTILMWLRKPVFGYGWGTYIHIGLSALGLNANGHNVYLQLLAETGIVGFLSFVSLALFSLQRAIYTVKHIKVTPEQKIFVCVGLSYQVFFLLYCFTGNCLYEANFYLPYFLSIIWNEWMIKESC